MEDTTHATSVKPRCFMSCKMDLIIIVVAIVLMIIVIVKLTKKESFINRSNDGYYWDTESYRFVSKNDKELACKVLLGKLLRYGINDITIEQLMKVKDNSLLDIIELSEDMGLTADIINKLRMYLNPNYYLALTYVNAARASRTFQDEIKKRFVYDVIVQYYTDNGYSIPIKSYDNVTDSEIITLFNNVQVSKLPTDSVVMTTDMDKVAEESDKYRNVAQIVTLPKGATDELVAPIIKPATTSV